jgi:hypothetical protein
MIAIQASSRQKHKTLLEKELKQKRTVMRERMAQVVECLPSPELKPQYHYQKKEIVRQNAIIPV